MSKFSLFQEVTGFIEGLDLIYDIIAVEDAYGIAFVTNKFSLKNCKISGTLSAA